MAKNKGKGKTGKDKGEIAYSLTVHTDTYMVYRSKRTYRTEHGVRMLYSPPRRQLYVWEIVPWERVLYVYGSMDGGECDVGVKVEASPEFAFTGTLAESPEGLTLTTPDGPVFVPRSRMADVVVAGAIDVKLDNAGNEIENKSNKGKGRRRAKRD